MRSECTSSVPTKPHCPLGLHEEHEFKGKSMQDWKTAAAEQKGNLSKGPLCDAGSLPSSQCCCRNLINTHKPRIQGAQFSEASGVRTHKGGQRNGLSLSLSVGV